MSDAGPGPPPIALTDATIGAEEIAAVTEVLASGWVSVGPQTRAFEHEFAALVGADDAVAVSNGTAALHLAFLALDLGPGAEIVMPSLSFVAAAAMARLAGATPVFADVCSESDLTVDPEQVETLLTDRTRAVVAMHYGGCPARVGDLRRLCDAASVVLVEDAAHAPGVVVAEGALGTIGDVGCFSFHATKNVTTGEGGMVVARAPAVRERVRRLRSHAIVRPTEPERRFDTLYDIDEVGLNYRPTDVSSAIGRVQLRRLADDRQRRHELVGAYRARLADNPEIVVPGSPSAPSAHHLMTVLLPPGTGRPAVRRAMAEAGIETSVHYPPTHRLTAYRALQPPRRLPVTDAVADRLLTLPLHARLRPAEVDRVTDVLLGSLLLAGRRS